MKSLEKCLDECQESIVNNFTETQIIAAVQYALRGNNPNDEVFEYEDTKDMKSEAESVYDIPSELKSQAKQILAEAVSYGIGSDVQWQFTCPQLERMVTVAAMRSGLEVLKSEHAQRTGAFYAAAGKIKTRLKAEKEKRERKENGKE